MPRSLPGPVMRLPSTWTSPVVGSSKPAMMRSRVDLPQPEAPIRQTNSPCATVTSMRPSASTSPSPTANRLLTPRIATWVSSRMVLRAPLQRPIADRDNDPVGHEAAYADHDHSRHHQVGARERAAVHDHRAQPGRNAGHLAHDNEDPGKAVRDAKPVEDRGQRGGQHDLAEHPRARAAEHGGGLEQARIHRAHAEDGVEQDGIERAEKDEK